MTKVPPAPQPGIRASIVLPVWNDVAHLPRTLERLSALPGDHLEMIIVNDGSTDGSGELAEDAATSDRRIRVLHQPQNAGVVAARRRGVRQSHGEWVWVIDSDDSFPADAMDNLLTAAMAHDADVVVGEAEFVYRDGAETRPINIPPGGPVDGTSAFRQLLNNQITGHLWNKLFRRDVLERSTWVNSKVHEDLALTASAISQSKRVAFARGPVYHYHVRPGSMITSAGSRAESLQQAHSAVRKAGLSLDRELLATDDWRYFEMRTIDLSALKDAALGPYRPQERRQLLRELRPRIGAAEFALIMRRRDLRRLAMAVAARTNVRLHRTLLRLAERSGVPVVVQSPPSPTGSAPEPQRTLLVASTGGHLAQLWRLYPSLGVSEDSLWVTFQTPQSVALLQGQRVHWMPYIRPRDWRGVLRGAAATWRILQTERYQRAVSTGAAVALAVLPVARLRGVPTEYIESVSRVDGPSMTGRLLSLVPGIRRYTQHPRWANKRWQAHQGVLATYRGEFDYRTPPSRPKLFVTLGTIHGYRFDTLIEAILRTGLADENTVWQLGETDVDDLPGTVHIWMQPDTFQAAIRDSDVVITHAGVGTLLGLLDAGRVPVMVPRRSARGEHVDDHQCEIARYAADAGVAVVAESDELTARHIIQAAAARVIDTRSDPRGDGPAQAEG